MSREKDEFDIAYREAYVSGTGRSIDDDLPELDEFISDFIGRPKLSYSGNDALVSKHEARLVRHPFGEAFIEDDLREAARVAFLGRALLDQAKVSLGTNVAWRTRDRSLGYFTNAFNIFQSFEWAKAHNFHEFPDKLSDPESASPLRLADWPKGEYINCLGVSIALAAAAELEGHDYLYANELRTSDDVISYQNKIVRDAVTRIVPEFFTDKDWESLMGYADFMRVNYSKYAGIMFNPDGQLVEGRSNELREWHHYVVTRTGLKDTSYGLLYQVDPYGLTADTVYADEHGIADDFITSNHPEDVLVLDSSYMFDEAFRHIQTALKKGSELVKRNKKRQGPLGIRTLIEGVHEVCSELMSDILDTGESGQDAVYIYDGYVEAMCTLAVDSYWYYLVEKACSKEVADELVKMSEKDKKIDAKRFKELDELAAQYVENFLRYDPEQKRVREVADSLPVVIITQIYVDLLKLYWNIKDTGTAHASMELADPELMIGAMYLNHYATHRKDGRINVARHLVKYTSSQLIWQAAQLDGESDEDPSMEAVGDIVAQLPQSQQHPRVALTVQTPK